MDAPQHLGKYEIRGTLGRGAMGVVYDGWDPAIARRVAIKAVALPDHPDPDTEEEIARFRREAQAAGRLTHPNIVAVYDYGETADLAYIVMEFVDGPTLKALLDKRERFALDRVARVMADLLAGLQFSHERGVVHRDIKPGNIMLTGAGQAKIADFGIARIEMSSMTQAGTMLGTPAYMSPEQFRGEVADARTDVYSAGVLLYQLLTGERPFEGGLTTIMHKVLNTEPPAPSQLSGTVPASLDAVVRTAMAKRPEARFASAAQFAEALGAALAAPPASDSGDDEATLLRPLRAVPTPAPAPVAAAAPAIAAAAPAQKSRLPLFGAIAAVLLLALAGGGWLLARPTSSQPVASQPVASQPVASQPVASPPVAPPPVAPQQMAQAAAAAVADAAPAPAAPPADPAPATAAPPPPVAPLEQATAPPPAPPAPLPAPLAEAPADPPAAAAIPAVARSEPADLVSSQGTPSRGAPSLVAPAPADATPAAPAPLQTAAITPVGALARIGQAVRDAACALATVEQKSDAGVAINGLADAATLARLRPQIEGAAGPPVAWHVKTIDPVFCPALALLRPISVLAGTQGPGVGLTLAGNKFVLPDGAAILPVLTMPDFAGELRVDYLSHDGSLTHLYPTLADASQKWAAQPGRRLAAGERLALGDRPGRPQWQSGEPYGTDMIFAVAASAPLRVSVTRNDEDKADGYLAALGRAVAQVRASGGRVSGALLLVDAVPKQN